MDHSNLGCTRFQTRTDTIARSETQTPMAPNKIETLHCLMIVTAAGVLLASCGSDHGVPSSGEGVLATVNGVPITEADVRLALTRSGAHGAEGAPKDNAAILENIIQQELANQRAVELQLDREPGYREELAKAEAQIRAFKRSRLSSAYFEHEIAKRAVVSDDEMREYIERNEVQLRTELHVWQILRRDPDSIEQMRRDLSDGMPFEQVAAGAFPEMPNMDRKPWDLGYLKWSQIPDAWRDLIWGLQAGEISDVIRGPNNRFWIIKLVDKREDPKMTIEDAKPRIAKILMNQKQQELRERLRNELRETARIIYP